MIKYISTKNPADCYGCRACEQVCNNEAILLEPDEEGFIYPVLNQSLCTNCGLCSKVCPIDKSLTNQVIKTAAAYYTDNKLLRYSASGGLFLAVADFFISQGGYVSGCVFDESFNAIHILSNEMSDIKRMQGSKYVQSDIGNVYIEIRRKLKEGKLVLFSGTPCQVDGLHKFLLKEYDNLYSLDLICHGVPSPQFLQDYLNSTHRINGKVVDFKFRNKEKNGWCSQGSIQIKRRGKIIEKKTSPFTDSYYYYYYLQNSISRMCCYSCKYSSTNRVGDISIGDYWNIADVLPDFDSKKGVSVVLINTNKGVAIFDRIKTSLVYKETSLEDAVRGNGNLSKPCSMPSNRFNIYKRIKRYGYRNIEKQECHYQYVIPAIKKMIPKSLKKIIKKFIK